jgi:hypothetical protein
MKISVEISAGELFDKITILSIKKQKINNEEHLKFIVKEYEHLNQISIPLRNEEIYRLEKELLNINLSLWDLENKVRMFENTQLFNNEFIDCCRNIYKFNDQRAAVKKEINIKLNSNFFEVKHHQKD